MPLQSEDNAIETLRRIEAVESFRALQAVKTLPNNVGQRMTVSLRQAALIPLRNSRFCVLPDNKRLPSPADKSLCPGLISEMFL